uniref:hypothetical protein n=1 Tax=Caulacanthus ustulatus TaxID=31411 RepID=UPI0027DA3EB3|nr:hypothetical protein REQ00_pgp122 [Caulacanthus ustulatus]WCH57303.1 hypothetical protein [Caulacanthus ustulatus]
MTSFTINSLMTWKSLPWKKINQRIFTLQEKIYKFSKQCDQKSVYEIQVCLLNSSDAKLLAIEEICSNLNYYYTHKQKKIYKIEDSDKWYIYKYLFHNTKNTLLQEYFFEYIRQYLIYLSIKPEWNAKSEPVYKQNKNNCYLIYRLCNFFSNNCTFKHIKLTFYKNILNKYIDVEKLITKIQSLPSISLYVKYWLNNQYFLDFSIIHSNIFKFSGLDMSKLINSIIHNGIEWYLMNNFHFNLKACELFKFIYLSNCFEETLELYFKYNNQTKKIFSNIKNLYNSIQFYYNNSVIWFNQEQQNSEHTIAIYNNFFITQKDSKKISKFYNNYVLYVHSSLYKKLLYRIKSFLYSYDFMGRLRNYKTIDLHKLFILTNNSIIDFYQFYYPLINSNNFRIILKLFEKTLFKWLKKNNNKISFIHNNENFLKCRLSYIT